MFTFCLFMVWLHTVKDLMQGKLFQRCTHILYCSVLSLGGNVNTRPMSKLSHKYNQWNILVIWNYNYVNYQNYQNSMLLTSSDAKRTLMHLFLFTNSARENWLQYVRRVYATAINFSCIVTLGRRMSLTHYFQKQLTFKPPFRSLVCFQGTSWPEQHLGPWEKNQLFFSL